MVRRHIRGNDAVAADVELADEPITSYTKVPSRCHGDGRLLFGAGAGRRMTSSSRKRLNSRERCSFCRAASLRSSSVWCATTRLPSSVLAKPRTDRASRPTTRDASGRLADQSIHRTGSSQPRGGQDGQVHRPAAGSHWLERSHIRSVRAVADSRLPFVTKKATPLCHNQKPHSAQMFTALPSNVLQDV